MNEDDNTNKTLEILAEMILKQINNQSAENI